MFVLAHLDSHLFGEALDDHVRIGIDQLENELVSNLIIFDLVKAVEILRMAMVYYGLILIDVYSERTLYLFRCF